MNSSTPGPATESNALARQAVNENAPSRALFFNRMQIQKIHNHLTSDPNARLSSEQSLELQRCLREFSQYDFVSRPEDMDTAKMRRTVLTLTNSQYYPDQIKDKADNLIKHWEAGNRTPINLDADEDSLDDFDEDQVIGTDTDESLFGDGNAESSKALSRSPDPAPQRGLTDPNNTTRNYLMRGIITDFSASGRKTYKLDPSYPKRPADVFGHNGLTPGDWWPFQICALRDGAHGARMAGISGKLPGGATSVVISGGSYEDQDQDQGDVIWYSGSMGQDVESTKKAPQRTMGVRCLLRAEKSGRKVRVLRTGKSHTRWAPSVGLRYDGLYKVTEHRVRKTDDGRWYYQFRLERAPNQPPINTSRPTPGEVIAYGALSSANSR